MQYIKSLKIYSIIKQRIQRQPTGQCIRSHLPGLTPFLIMPGTRLGCTCTPSCFGSCLPPVLRLIPSSLFESLPRPFYPPFLPRHFPDPSLPRPSLPPFLPPEIDSAFQRLSSLLTVHTAKFSVLVTPLRASILQGIATLTEKSSTVVR